MGRNKRWCEVSSGQLVLLCFLASIVLGDGEVGCLFSNDVCRTGIETCFDDFAFGKCVPAFGEIDEQEGYQYDLDLSELELLRRELQRLILGRYSWTNPYTQCVIQSSLYGIRFRLKHTEFERCQTLKNVEDSKIEDFHRDEADEPNEDSDQLAVVNFTPIRGHGYGEYANEKFYPPGSPRKPPRHENSRESGSPNDYDIEYGPSFVSQSNDGRSLPGELINQFSAEKNINGKFNAMSLELNNLARRLKHEKPFYRSRREPRWNLDESEKIPLPSRDESDLLFEVVNLPENDDDDDTILKSKRQSDWSYSPMDYNAWNFLLANNGTSSSDDENEKLEFLGNRDEKRTNVFDDNAQSYESENYKDRVEDENNEEAVLQLEQSLKRMDNQRNNKAVLFTEGGFLQPEDFVDSPADDVIFENKDEDTDNEAEDDNVENNEDENEINTLLWGRNLGAFQRPERVDVKKPGPLYSTNNYAFKTQSSSGSISNDIAKMKIEGDEDPKVLQSSHQMQKKTLSYVNYNGVIYEDVDLDYIYVKFNKDFAKWADGRKIVDDVAKLLNLDPDSLSDVKVGRAEVTFKVTQLNTNPDAPDAITLVEKITAIKKDLEKITGLTVTEAGLGNEVKLPSVFRGEHSTSPGLFGAGLGNEVKLPSVFRGEDSMSPGLFGATVAGAGAAAAAAAVVTLVIARKHAKSRAKLAGLATPDPEASKDYQDLCRARMHAKQPSDKPESPRIISLSKENESNRSSTSSWGEEAAALTNMDISTGHMVLTYMEDHLKNKDRLDREWAGICAYEADPCSTKTAMEKSNSEKNRPGASLPYDHSRVVLNDLSNATNSDYINASTITDHDPRNPAYIATQGPLPQTSADFWQLVWEQGSVVIVMLTRLTEEGRGMCHRYWPDEGSELYHIYEVHIVSEHIWCDDYLVRSFYLKNLRTGETRTVTQFHFLSWPENGVPHSTKALLEFRRKVNKSYRGRSCPIVVHCSDGAGRTGTYCLIDMVLNRMAKGAKEIDIAAALEHIRDQRPGMVATKQQFEFVLVAIAGEVHAILKALPIQPISATTSEPEKSKIHQQ